MKRVAYILLALPLVLSCIKEDDRIEAVEIGVMENDVFLECSEGEYVMSVLASGDFTAVIDEGDWLAFEGGSLSYNGSTDQDVRLVYPMNRGASRTAHIVLSSGSRRVEVCFTQKGIIDMGLKLLSHNVNFSAEGGLQSVKVETLLKNEELVYEVEYKGVEGWISGVEKENNTIKFNLKNNSSSEARTAVVRIASKEDRSVCDELNVQQQGESTEFSPISFTDLHALAATENIVKIDRDLVLDCRVLNDNSEGNGAEILNISSSLQDSERAFRVVYVQNSDATAGVLVEFESPKDNTTRRFDRLSLNLNGMTLRKYSATDDEPLRYELTGAVVDNILETEGGSVHDLPEKERYISALTDADVYTYVTLKECEIPVRKGPFVPLDLRYDDGMNKYPMPLRDKEGSSTFIMTNTSCAWARDGKGLPQGAGKLSGIIVHEKCDNFEWDTDAAAIKMASGVGLDYVTGVGTISRYQIRPVVKSDIALADDFSSSFSEMLMEVSYVNKDYDNLVVNVDQSWSIYSTWPQTPYPLNDPNVTGVLRRYRGGVHEAFGLWRDWTHLGPVENGRITNPSGGNGVTDYYGASAHWNVHSQTASSGLIIDANGSAWYTTKWNNDQYVQAEFSTESLASANFPVSVTLGACNGLGESVGAPRYWKMEYSADGKNWTKFADYTVPDFPIVYQKRSWQCPGFKMMTFNLPEDDNILGKSKVYIRIKAADQRAGTMDSYDGGTVSSTNQSAMNYFAVRYNKL